MTANPSNDMNIGNAVGAGPKTLTPALSRTREREQTLRTA